MKCSSSSLGILLSLCAVFFWNGSPAAAQQAGVASTLHNLSVTGPGDFKSQTETEVCKFCHIPHNAVIAKPLWGHALSQVAQYKVPRIRRGGRASEPAPQPGGSSRMCLSCHDGTVALGKIAGNNKRVKMAGAQRLSPGRKGFLGTDLSGSHPISFVVPDGDPGGGDGARDMRIKPLPNNNSAAGARLDKKGKMQCTTCHDPHSDEYYQPERVPHFWARPSVEEVCLTCHALQ